MRESCPNLDVQISFLKNKVGLRDKLIYVIFDSNFKWSLLFNPYKKI
jgi:hypothetical protein